jgi:hypothetical protein
MFVLTPEIQIGCLVVLVIIDLIIVTILSQFNNITLDESEQRLQDSITHVQEDSASKIITSVGISGDQGSNGSSGVNGSNGNSVTITPLIETLTPAMIPADMEVTVTFYKIDRLVTVQIQTTAYPGTPVGIFALNGFFPTTYAPLITASFPVVAIPGDFSTVFTITAYGTFIYVNPTLPIYVLNQTFTYISAT